MPPDVLQDLVRRGVEQYVNFDAMEAVTEREEADKARLRGFVGGLED